MQIDKKYDGGIFKRWGCLIWFAFHIFYCGSNLFAQTYGLNISNVTNEKGEDCGSTGCIVQDSTGYMWFGTVDGLYRYDGFNYKVYRSEKGNSNSIRGNTIRSICLGQDNTLWIGIQGQGIDCMDLTTEKIKHYYFPKSNKIESLGNDIWVCYADHYGNIWISTVDNGLEMLDRKTRTFHHFPIISTKEALNGNIIVHAIFEDNNGFIWVGMDDYGLVCLNPKTGQVTNYRHNPSDPSSICSNNIYHIFENSKGQLFLSTYGNGVCLYDLNLKKFIRLDHVGNCINQIKGIVYAAIEKRPNEYWIGLDNGFTILDLNRSTITNYFYEKNILNTISDNRIRFVYKDRKGIVWLGNDAGVDKIVEQNKFLIFKPNSRNSNTIPTGNVRSIFEDKEKNIWFSIINKGLVKYNPITNSFVQYVNDQKKHGSLPGNYISAIFQDNYGTLWFGEWDNGLVKYNRNNGAFQIILNETDTRTKLSNNRIQFIKEAKPGILWIGTERGLNRYDIKNDLCTYQSALGSKSLQSNAFIQDSSGGLWLGTWLEGLYHIKFTDSLQKNCIIQHWSVDTSISNSLNR